MTSDLLGKLTAIDPFPDDADAPTGAVTAAAVLRDIEWRSAMQTQQEPTVERPQRRWSPWAAVAAFAAVIAIGVVGALLMRGDGEPVEPVPTTIDAAPSTTVAPTTTSDSSATTTIPAAHLAFVTAYEEAFNAGDAEAFRALFLPDAVLIEDEDAVGFFQNVDTMVLDMMRLHERGTKVQLVGCTATPNGLACTTTQTGPVEEALYGVAVASRDLYDLDPAGKIARIKWGLSDPVGEGRDPEFHAWMLANHPEAATLLTPCCWNSRITGEDAYVYAEWIPIWVEAGRPSE